VIDAAREPFGVVRRLDLVRRWGNDTSSRQSEESAELKWIKREKAELLQTNGTLKANSASLRRSSLGPSRAREAHSRAPSSPVGYSPVHRGRSAYAVEGQPNFAGPVSAVVLGWTRRISALSTALVHDALEQAIWARQKAGRLTSMLPATASSVVRRPPLAEGAEPGPTFGPTSRSRETSSARFR
jgi:hypothetical protein